MFNNRFEQRLHGSACFMDLAHCIAFFRAGVDDWKIKLLIRRVQLDEQIKYHIQHLVRTRVFAIDFVNHNNRLRAVLERFSQNEFRLRLRSFMRVDYEQNAIDHFHDPLDFAPEIGVPGSIDDINVIILVPVSRVLRSNGYPFFSLQVHGVHNAFLDLLIYTESPGLAQQLVHQRCFAVVHVSDNRDVTNTIHNLKRAGKMQPPAGDVKEWQSDEVLGSM